MYAMLPHVQGLHVGMVNYAINTFPRTYLVPLGQILQITMY